jgi:1,4-alpha-glucan branching enzyme
MNKKD